MYELLTGMALWCAGPALAQGFDGHGANIPPDNAALDDPVYGLGGARTGAPTFTAVVQVASDTLAERITDGDQVRQVDVLGSLGGVELGFVSRVVGPVGAGLSLPVWFLVDGQASGPATLGDATVWVPVNLLAREHLRVGLAPVLVLPTGPEARFLGEPGFAAGALVSGGLAAGPWFANLDVGADATPATGVEEWPGGGYGRYALDLGVLPADVVGVHAELRSRFPFDSAAPSLPAEVLGAVRGRPLDRLWLTAALGTAVTRGVGAAGFRVMIGFATAPGEAPVELEVNSGPLTKDVHVVDVRRFPLGGASVTLGQRTQTTDFEGFAEVNARAVERFGVIEVSRDGFETVRLQVDPAAEYYEATLVRVPVPVAISVVGPEGALALTDVYLTGPYDAGEPQIDEAGVFHWSLRPGVWKVRLSSPGLGSQERTVVIEEQRAAPIRVDAVLTSLVDESTVVRVLVVDRLGRPVEDAVVAIGDRDLGTTGTAGDVVIEGLQPGPITLVARSERFGDDTSVELEVAPGEQTVEAVLDWRPGSVLVRVTDANGFPIPAQVAFIGPADLPVRELDDSGEELFVLRPGTWDVAVSADDMGPQVRRVRTTSTPGELALLAVRLLPAEQGPATMEVRTVDVDGQPLADVAVRFDGAEVGTTGPEGNLVLHRLHPGLRNMAFARDLLVSRDQEVDLVAGRQVVEVVMSWLDGVTDLVVVDADGQPVDATVSSTGPVGLTDIRIGPDGTERVVLPVGQWSLTFAAEGLEPERRMLDVAAGSRRRATVRVQMQAVAAASSMVLDVVDPTGAPVDDVTVTLDGESVGVVDETGLVRLDGVAAGAAELEVSAPGMVPARIPVVVPEPGAPNQVAVVEMGWQPGTVQVTVTDEQGVPIAAEVSLRGPESSATRSTDGDPVRIAAKPGTWFVVVEAEGKQTEEVAVELPPEAALTPVVVAMEDLADDAPATVVLQVETPEGVAVADATVKVDGVEVGHTSGAGLVELPQLPGAGATVEVVPEHGYEPVSVDLSRPRARDQGTEIKHTLVVEPEAQPVEITVTDASGAPVVAEVVAVGGAEWEEPTRAGRDGRTSLDLKPGTWTITARTDDGATATAQLVVPPPSVSASGAAGGTGGGGAAGPEVTLVVARVQSTLEGNRLHPPQPILFNFAKFDIRDEVHPLLDDLVKWLNSHPEAALVEVGGHTDDVGGVAYNQQLSESRARAIEAALVARGVARERLMSRGYGLSRPVTALTDPESRQRNRRVELTVLEWSGR